MRHIKTLSHAGTPALAGTVNTNIFDCLSTLVNTGNFQQFKSCLSCKLGIGPC